MKFNIRNCCLLKDRGQRRRLVPATVIRSDYGYCAGHNYQRRGSLDG